MKLKEANNHNHNRFIHQRQPLHHHLHRRISGERLGLRFGPGGAESPVPCGLGRLEHQGVNAPGIPKTQGEPRLNRAGEPPQI